MTQPDKVSLEIPGVLSYLEVRGLCVRGNGDTAREKYPAELGTSSLNTDSQGIVINGRTGPDSRPRLPTDLVHHIRLADNLVEFCTADGIYVEFCDWLSVENNRIENNCWTTAGYAPSGFALMGYANFDAQDNIFKILIAGNRASGNRLTVKNHFRGENPKTRYYNGNGFLLDANADKAVKYLGRTLVQNNLAFNNGAGGIQCRGSHRLDVVNNTVSQNATVIPWGQVAFEYCRDVRLINNIIVAPPGLQLDTWFLGRADERTAGNVRINNLYWGGAHPNVSGVNDLKADPLFVSANEFSLQPISPAVTAGRWETFTPIVDLEGNPRPLNASPSAGAFQLTSSAAAAAGSAQSKPFGGKPWPIPGLIQAENFDEGPEGVAFHETDPLKGNLIARPYRNSPVDIEDSKAGAFLIGVIKNGEWWSYTVDVKKAGSYDIDVSLARWNKPGSVHLEFNGVDKTGPIEAELTKKCDVFSNVRKSAVTLETGVQVMKVVAHGDDEIINLDSIRISPAGTLPVNTVAAAKPTFGEWYYAGSLIAGKETTPANAALHELPMLPALNGNQGFYPVVESDVPVMVEQTRRPVVNENPAPRGGWHLMALPIGDVELKN